MTKKTSNKDVKIGKCEYHLCRKRTTVHKCKYCGGYFCDEHIEPTIVIITMRDIWETKQPDKDIKEKAWRKENAHPCWPYSKIFWEKVEEQKQRETEERREALDRMKYLKTESRAGDGEVEVYQQAQFQVWWEDIVSWFKKYLLKLLLVLLIVGLTLMICGLR